MLKKNLLLPILCLLFSFAEMKAANITAYYDQGIFLQPGKGPYLEFYLKIPVSSLKYLRGKDEQFHAAVQMEYSLSKGDSVLYQKKYMLQSPLLADTLHRSFNLLDLQRLPLENGEYSLRLSVADANDSSSFAGFTQPVEVKITADGAAFSHVLLLDSFYESRQPSLFTRGDMDMLPMVNTLAGPAQHKLYFYTELYNTLGIQPKTDISFLYYLKDRKGRTFENYTKTRQRKSAALISLFDAFDISGLPTGEYNLVIEASDSKGTTIARQELPFTRLQENMNMADLSQYVFLKSVSFKEIIDFGIYMPLIAASDEAPAYETLSASQSDSLTLKHWFYIFWKRRNPAAPGRSYADFMQAATEAETLYALPSGPKGYQTDRGRILLLYGKPDRSSEHPAEPGLLPYEIWEYDRTAGQNNISFVFYSQENTGKTYTLIHSNARNEKHAPDWKNLITKPQPKEGSKK